MSLSLRLRDTGGLLYAGFSPRDVAGLVLWLSAAREAARRGLVPGQSVALDTWADLGGRGNHATQGTASKRPVLLHDGTRWVAEADGVDDVLTVANSPMLRNVGGVTIIAAVRRPSTTARAADDTVFIATTNAANFTRAGLFHSTSAATYFVGGRRLDTDGFQTVSGGVLNTAWHVQTGVLDYASARARLYLDGAQIGASDAFQTPGTTSDTNSVEVAVFGHSGGYLFLGQIAGLVVYNRALSDGERKRVERYLDREARLGLNL